MKFVLGTRGSQLSIAQTNWIVSELKKKNPEHEFEIVTIKTKGDTDARPLFTIDQKGIFEKRSTRPLRTSRSTLPFTASRTSRQP